jgi:two-component system, chemotaxis family, response regulator Rcp1
MAKGSLHPIEILLVEDSPGDIRLTQEVLKEGPVQNHLNVVDDGAKAIAYLYQNPPYTSVPIPDLILLDLNLPKKDGREVLSIIKGDKVRRRIPVIVLTTSQADEDILHAYNLHANCYITKPVGLDQFVNVVRSIEEFWLSTVRLPSE